MIDVSPFELTGSCSRLWMSIYKNSMKIERNTYVPPNEWRLLRVMDCELRGAYCNRKNIVSNCHVEGMDMPSIGAHTRRFKSAYPHLRTGFLDIETNWLLSCGGMIVKGVPRSEGNLLLYLTGWELDTLDAKILASWVGWLPIKGRHVDHVAMREAYDESL